MNYKCPLRNESAFGMSLCDPLCRFYDQEPQKSSVDPNGEGSCVLAHAAMVHMREIQELSRLTIKVDKLIDVVGMLDP